MKSTDVIQSHILIHAYNTEQFRFGNCLSMISIIWQRPLLHIDYNYNTTALTERSSLNSVCSSYLRTDELFLKFWLCFETGKCSKLKQLQFKVLEESVFICIVTSFISRIKRKHSNLKNQVSIR